MLTHCNCYHCIWFDCLDVWKIMHWGSSFWLGVIQSSWQHLFFIMTIRTVDHLTWNNLCKNTQKCRRRIYLKILMLVIPLYMLKFVVVSFVTYVQLNVLVHNFFVKQWNSNSDYKVCKHGIYFNITCFCTSGTSTAVVLHV